MSEPETPAPSKKAPAAPPPPARRHRMAALALGGVLVVAIVAVTVLSGKLHPAAAPPAPEGPRLVRTAPTKPAERTAAIALPGTARPAETVIVVAKATGYVEGLTVDLGDKVTAGQPLMRIGAREVVAELAVARARLREAAENVALAEATAARMTKLAAAGDVSKQEAENATAALNSARARVATSHADIERLDALVGYQRITAPFAGTVVRRYVDPGALAQAGVTQLIQIAATDQLDIEIDVPQQAATRALRVEIRVPATAGILPNSYVTVTITVDRPNPPVVVPVTAVVAGGEGTRVVVVDKANTVKYRRVTVVRDLGKAAEVDGVTVGEVVVENVPADLKDGETIRVAPPEKAEKAEKVEKP